MKQHSVKGLLWNATECCRDNGNIDCAPNVLFKSKTKENSDPVPCRTLLSDVKHNNDKTENDAAEDNNYQLQETNRCSVTFRKEQHCEKWRKTFFQNLEFFDC
ncbi:Proteasome subunit beta [Trichinella pseudospiralis]|uniref:Uncharacterized protein n=1 Tax=Trichinella pseudospiralis TaxID=6337 RepID=A0A0V1FEG6_TRIPS|nr:hypothetical protein T4D_163 [Trichinella pseudospiralis]